MKKKMKIDIKHILNQKENMALIAVAIVLCAGVTINYVKAGKIPLHDGDILVDSQNVAVEEIELEEDVPETATVDHAAQPSDFESQRAELDLQRNQLLAGYENTIKNSTNETEQKHALEDKEKLTGDMEQEIALESIIRSKNLPESMVIITDKMVNVTVNEQELKQNVVAKICHVVMEETKRSADKIIIQSAY